MKLKNLEGLLENVQGFANPKIDLEQYPTDAHLASLMVYNAEFIFGDILNKTVVDLGCGCGMLTIASALLGSGLNIAVDIDKEALEVFKSNLTEFELEVEMINVNVQNLTRINADVVLMNPPFGTRLAGIDVVFLKKALQIAPVVYSMHKTSTRNFLLKKASEFNATVNVFAELKFNLPRMYKFHKKDNLDVQVDLIRFSRKI